MGPGLVLICVAGIMAVAAFLYLVLINGCPDLKFA